MMPATALRRATSAPGALGLAGAGDGVRSFFDAVGRGEHAAGRRLRDGTSSDRRVATAHSTNGEKAHGDTAGAAARSVLFPDEAGQAPLGPAGADKGEPGPRLPPPPEQSPPMSLPSSSPPMPPPSSFPKVDVVLMLSPPPLPCSVRRRLAVLTAAHADAAVRAAAAVPTGVADTSEGRATPGVRQDPLLVHAPLAVLRAERALVDWVTAATAQARAPAQRRRRTHPPACSSQAAPARLNGPAVVADVKGGGVRPSFSAAGSSVAPVAALGPPLLASPDTSAPAPPLQRTLAPERPEPPPSVDEAIAPPPITLPAHIAAVHARATRQPFPSSVNAAGASVKTPLISSPLEGPVPAPPMCIPPLGVAASTPIGPPEVGCAPDTQGQRPALARFVVSQSYQRLLYACLRARFNRAMKGFGHICIQHRMGKGTTTTAQNWFL